MKNHIDSKNTVKDADKEIRKEKLATALKRNLLRRKQASRPQKRA